MRELHLAARDETVGRRSRALVATAVRVRGFSTRDFLLSYYPSGTRGRSWLRCGMQPTIGLESLSKSFGTFAAVRNLSFSVRAGEVLGLVGPNGAGKTTTLRIMAGIIPPTDGKVLI